MASGEHNSTHGVRVEHVDHFVEQKRSTSRTSKAGRVLLVRVKLEVKITTAPVPVKDYLKFEQK